MANREKKITIAKKQASASPVPPKESVLESALEAQSSTSTEIPKGTIIRTQKGKLTKSPSVKNTTVVANKLKKNITKTVVKKNLSVNFKAKNKKPTKINQKLTKAILSNTKTIEAKKSPVLKNGVKQAKIRKVIEKKTEIPQNDLDDSPPVLEPILPLDENVDIKKQSRRRINKKSPVLQSEEENKTPKFENHTEQNLLGNLEIAKQVKKPRGRRLKTENTPEVKSESLEDVMNDLSYLITKGEVKTETDMECDSGKTDNSVKSNKRTITRKSKMDLFNKRLVKKENIENILSSKLSLDSSANNLIDMLDLNVSKTKEVTPVKRRRHSIEKFPLSFESPDNSNYSPLIFTNLPRCRSPRTKRASKLRQSCEIIPFKRSSPYSTRSDSPARILRNGKHRKLKDNLLDGLDSEYKKRRRLCSDFSGSEKSVSKLSGYDSDSSFSDLASLIGTENMDTKDAELLNKLEGRKEIIPISQTSSLDLLVKSNNAKLIVPKRVLPADTNSNGIVDLNQKIDTNSNLFSNIKPGGQDKLQDHKLTLSGTPLNLHESPLKSESTNLENLTVCQNASSKVPEKEILLDIMKQTFNDVKLEDQEKRATRSSTKKSGKQTDDDTELTCMRASKFYGTTESNAGQNSGKADVQENSSTENIKAARTLSKRDSQNENSENCEKSKSQNDCEQNLENKTLIQETLELQPLQSNIHNGSETMETLPETTETLPDENLPEKQILPTTDDLTYKENSDILEEAKEDSNRMEIVETPENLAIKENILQALGLQSLKAAEEAKLKVKEKGSIKQDYTGTLKTVIKLNRFEKKKSRSSLKMTLQKTKSKTKDVEQDNFTFDEEDGQKVNKENASSSWKSSYAGQTSDTAGAQRKSHYSNRSNNLDGSSEHTSDGDNAGTEGEDSGKVLVIPEKASSFSIHPGRLCKDECSYCFGKFGLFDTPCHIAQMKSVERQDRILATEKHLTRDSCLCDACYRHVDRKSNTPSYTNKSSKRSSIVAPGPRQNHCHVLGCKTIASNILRRKWIIKMRKNVCQVINIDLDNPGLHSIPICEEHFAALEHLMVCAMCKRRLARNHIHYLGPETNDLNDALTAEGLPIKLSDKPIVCKLCRYFATLILKPVDERPENSVDFFKEYKRRLLHFNDLEVMDEAAAEEPIPVPTKEKHDKEQVKKKKKIIKNQNANGPPILEPQVEVDKSEQTQVSSESTSSSNEKSRSGSPAEYMVDYNNLVPTIALECGNSSDANMAKKDISKNQTMLRNIPKPESVKEAVEISKNMKLASNICIKPGANVVQRLGANSSISVRQLFPGEEEMGLQANIEFNNVKERTPEGWEKCTSTIQYDMETKHLWQELQKPYGNLSSFLRHLILLEKYFRNGDLVLSANATNHSVNYSESVQNRLRAYDNIPSNLSVPVTVKKSSSGIITTKEVPQSVSHTVSTANTPKNTPITLSQITSLSGSTTTVSATAVSMSKHQRNPGLPPGLISIHPGTTRPVAPLMRVPQTQKIKIPLTKNWRPNLIPIDPTKKPDKDKKMEYVKVISGGKPYHITLEDYQRICAIKRSCDLKQKRLQEATKASNSILRQVYLPRKGLVVPKNNQNINNTATTSNEPTSPEVQDGENSLKKLDEAVEKLESKLSEPKSVMILPKIPKSLTVIPQTVSRKSSRPSSPVLQITPKPKAAATTKS